MEKKMKLKSSENNYYPRRRARPDQYVINERQRVRGGEDERETEERQRK